MKNYLFLSVLLLFSIRAAGQDNTLARRFSLVAQWSGATQINDSTFKVTPYFPNDQLGQGYLPTGIDSGFMAVGGLRRLYRIDSVANATFSTADLWLVELADNDIGPIGVGQVYEPDPDYPLLIPPMPDNQLGTSPAYLSEIAINNLLRLKDASPDIGPIIADSLNAFTAALTSPYLPYWNGTSFVNSWMTNQSDRIELDPGKYIEIEDQTTGNPFIRFNTNNSHWDILYPSDRQISFRPGSTNTAHRLIYEDNAGTDYFHWMPNASPPQWNIINNVDFRVDLGTGINSFELRTETGGVNPGWHFQRTVTGLGYQHGLELQYIVAGGTWSSRAAQAPLIITDSTRAPVISFHPYYKGIAIQKSNATPAYSLDIGATDAVGMPAGTTVQQPLAGRAGALRYNTTTSNVFEGDNGTEWIPITWGDNELQRNANDKYLAYWSDSGNDWKVTNILMNTTTGGAEGTYYSLYPTMDYMVTDAATIGVRSTASNWFTLPDNGLFLGESTASGTNTRWKTPALTLNHVFHPYSGAVYGTNSMPPISLVMEGVNSGIDINEYHPRMQRGTGTDDNPMIAVVRGYSLYGGLEEGTGAPNFRSGGVKYTAHSAWADQIPAGARIYNNFNVFWWNPSYSTVVTNSTGSASLQLTDRTTHIELDSSRFELVGASNFVDPFRDNYTAGSSFYIAGDRVLIKGFSTDDKIHGNDTYNPFSPYFELQNTDSLGGVIVGREIDIRNQHLTIGDWMKITSDSTDQGAIGYYVNVVGGDSHANKYALWVEKGKTLLKDTTQITELPEFDPAYYVVSDANGVLGKKAFTPAYCQIAFPVTFAADATDAVDTVTIDTSWSYASRPIGFNVIDTTAGHWDADSLVVGKLIYTGSTSRRFLVNLNFSADANGSTENLWWGALIDNVLQNYTVKRVEIGNQLTRDYSNAFIVTLATNEELDFRFKVVSSIADTASIDFYNYNITITEL